ncbi:uncharacterized protein [Macrobrachium rosenbergii]|uniref:uncharacterized protein n=1 Tax=Macrobrachium rosenbergii TaxID=79674 RepID=UPI0034D4AD97
MVGIRENLSPPASPAKLRENQTKWSPSHPPLQNIPSVGVPFQDVVIDFYTPKGRKKKKTGNTHVLSIIDRFTRYPEVIPVRSMSLKNVVRALIQFFCQFGFLATVQSDEGQHFMSKEFRDAMTTHGVTHLHSTPYHPKSQGIIECFHQTLGTNLSLSECTFLIVEDDETEDDEEKQNEIEENTTEEIEDSNESKEQDKSMDAENLIASTYETSEVPHTEGPGATRTNSKVCKVLAEENGSSWEENLPYALFAIRQAPSETLGYSPFELLFAHSTSGPLDILYEAWAEPEKAAWAENLPHIQRNLKAAWTIAQAHEAASQERVKIRVDKEARSRSFKVGDQVLVLCLGATRPLETQFTGPHQILARRGQLNYLVDCSKRRAKWLHINLLEPFKKQEAPQETPLELPATGITIGLVERVPCLKPTPKCWLTSLSSPLAWTKPGIKTFGLFSGSTPKLSGMYWVAPPWQSIGQAPFLSKIDLEKGYWQVPLSPESRPPTAFTTPSGHYQCRVMPFGLKNAPSCFQQLMNEVLAGIPNCVVYLDDIVIFSRTWEEHQRVLEQVLEALRRENLIVNLNKCHFGVAEITYLGRIVGNGNLRPKDANIQAIREMAYPTTKRDAQRFLGTVQYFRQFIPNLSEAAVPITQLLWGNQEFHCTPECKKAYDHLKEVLISKPVLRTPDYDRPFYLAVDASDVGVGAVLFQEKDRFAILSPTTPRS